MNFFMQKKNIILSTAIVSIVLGTLTMVLATPYAFGPWIRPDTFGITIEDKFLSFIFITAIFFAMTEIILGAALCTQKYREKLAVIIPLFTAIASKLVLIIISTIIFGFMSGISNILFYVFGFLLIAATLAGFIYSFTLKEGTAHTRAPAKPKEHQPA